MPLKKTTRCGISKSSNSLSTTITTNITAAPLTTTTPIATTTTTTNITIEKEWPVELYRYTESEGWQKQVPKVCRHDSNNNINNIYNHKNSFVLAVAPRKDCIVIPLLRQKFTLTSTATSNNSSSNVGGGGGGGSGTTIYSQNYNSNNYNNKTNNNTYSANSMDNNNNKYNHNNNENNNNARCDDVRDRSTMIRRGDTILLVSRRRTRAMVLRFRTLDECLEFSDRFIELNPPSPPISHINRSNNILNHNNHYNNYHHHHHHFDDSSYNNSPITITTNGSTIVGTKQQYQYQQQQYQQQQQQLQYQYHHHQQQQQQPLAVRQYNIAATTEEQIEVTSYIVRLLHDKEFLNFIHKMETFLSNTIDGSKILKSLETRDIENSDMLL